MKVHKWQNAWLVVFVIVLEVAIKMKVDDTFDVL